MSGGVASLTVEVEERRVSRTLFRGAVSNNYLLERVRAIQLLKTDNLGDGLPEYRIFDIKEGSPYDLVGMKNADVLVGLNDYPIDEASKIPKFMYLLQGENSGLIEVRRQGKPILLKISFLD
jgi:type II secretory pathway component PulC